MNQSRFPTLSAAAAALATQMAFASGAEAAAIPVKQGTTLTGIDGLLVDGVLYDVTFIPDSSNPVPQFRSQGAARDAANALGTELFSLPHSERPPSNSIFTIFTPAPGSSGNVQAYEIVLGTGFNTFGLEIIGPQPFGSVVDTNATGVELFVDVVGPPINLGAPFSPDGTGDYAIWTPMTVPEPSSLVLMGVGMAGMAAAAATRRKKKPA